jgi:acyl carrier protein
VNRLPELQNLFAEIFGVERLAIASDTVQGEVPEWDSVGHLNLMLALEASFDVQLEVQDMQNLTSVSAILEFLESRCPSS